MKYKNEGYVEPTGDWSRIKGLFHDLWGNASSGEYEKSTWVKLQIELEAAERRDKGAR